jgi:hypothetical protein
MHENFMTCKRHIPSSTTKNIDLDLKKIKIEGNKLNVNRKADSTVIGPTLLN